jgi:hypothetical protein
MTTLSTKLTALDRLRQRDADEAARLRSRPRATYRATLESLHAASRERALAAGVAPGAPGSLLDAIDTELTALAKAQALRPQLEAALAKYPLPSPSDAKPLAAALRAYREVAQGALATLDNTAPLEDWKRRIVETPEDVGSPSGRAAAHFLEIVPLLDRARSLAGVLVELDGLARGVEELAVALEARGAPTEITVGLGSVAPDAAAERPRRAVSKLSGGEEA